MVKKYTLVFTSDQLEAFKEIIDTMSGMTGVGSDFDEMANKQVRLLDRVLINNGHKRNFK